MSARTETAEAFANRLEEWAGRVQPKLRALLDEVAREVALRDAALLVQVARLSAALAAIAEPGRLGRWLTDNDMRAIAAAALKPDPAIAAARQEHAKVAPFPAAPGDTEPEIERVPAKKKSLADIAPYDEDGDWVPRG